MLQVFLLYTVAGTLFKSLKAMLETPEEFLNLLKYVIPANSSFYLKYILTGIFSGCAVNLSRLSYFLYAALRRQSLLLFRLFALYLPYQLDSL